MKTRTNYTLIGAFIIGGLLLLVGWVLTLRGASAAESFYFETYFEETVNGLARGSAVRFRGVRVGEVDEIHIAGNVYDTQQPFVVVTARLHQKGVDPEKWREILDRQLPQGLFVRLAAQGLTGGMYLEADLPVDAAHEPVRLPYDWTPAHTYVPSETSTIGQLRVTIDELAVNIRKIDFAALADELQSTLRSIRTEVDAADIGAVSQKMQGLLDDGAVVLDNTRQVLSKTGTRADQVLDDCSVLLSRLESEIQAGGVHELLQDLSLTVKQMPDVATDMKIAMESLIGSARQIEALIRLKGRDVDLILENVRIVTANLARLANMLERYPSLLLFGDAPAQAVGPGVGK